MEECGSPSTGLRSDIRQLQLEAQHRWLRPAEILEILQNYQNFRIASDPPVKPLSGSLFIFDRKVLRYFRKDGHNWRKKKDGKTVREAHEKLKVGSVDVLHCYYAHGEENENFQRRSYWMLEQDFMHIVFVHYLEVKGNKTSISCIRNTENVLSDFQHDSPLSFSSANTDATSPKSTLMSAYDDAELEDNHQASSKFQSFPEVQLVEHSRVTDKIDASLLSSCNLLPCSGSQSIPGVDSLSLSQGDRDCGDGSFMSGSQRTLDLASWEEVLESCTDIETSPSEALISSNDIGIKETILEQGNGVLSQLLAGEISNKQDPANSLPVQSNWQRLLVGSQRQESLKKADSFSRWIATELGEVEEMHMQSTNDFSWSLIENGDAVNDFIPSELQLDTDLFNPFLAQDQLFSIIDFSPTWAVTNLETEVLIAGKFLSSQQEVENCKWSCMFGEVEVPAEIFADGLFRCHAPPHRAGLVPFYVTCSNRLACSEVREFEYRVGSTQDINATYIPGSITTEMVLQFRLEKLLSLGFAGSPITSERFKEKQNIVSTLISLMEEDENYLLEKLTPEKDFVQPKLKDRLLEKPLKVRLCTWLLNKVTEDGKGPSVLDEEGQGVLHLAAALGYNWALRPTIISGVNIDFRDVNGWTALHWAAFCGREDTVAALVSLCAAPGALTDPSLECPLGRTPADLASASGHKGISGFLAESSLTTHLSSLTMNEAKEDDSIEISGVKTINTVSERTATPTTAGDVPDVLSLKDSLAAVCNAAQAASRIHQIFRMQSFQRKQFVKHESDKSVPVDDHELALSVVAAKKCRMGLNDGTANAAATCIQKKFRGWNKRKEFLILRRRVVKIQAHVRGHQVRKKYKPIIWSVGILEKVILRWRRKGGGLRGFRSHTVLKAPNTKNIPLQEDDCDFLKEGRKQTEERSQKALARVKSMVQYPEARAQYRRLLTVAEGFRETKDACSVIPTSPEDPQDVDHDLIDIETLLDDDTFMSMTFA